VQTKNDFVVTNPAIEQAMQSVQAAEAKAATDPRRPRFHFRPPANWMNDPNGTIYHNGYYHLFYQHNPYGDDWGHIHWGHARSRDLVHWKHLPIALWPSQELGEEHNYSGCATLNDQGQPMLIYTSVGPGERGARPDNQQWAALGDPDWITWQKHPQNPILALESHGGPALAGDWRDPFVFHAGGRTFLVLGGVEGEHSLVVLYEAADPSLATWTYRKVLYSEPRRQMRFPECPNFFAVDGRWVLLTSPYRPVEYVTGDFDVETLTFTPATRGVLDPGYNRLALANYYATNVLYAPDGRCILLGWVRGFAAGRGWNGCLALPRVMTIGPDGRPRQTPVAELDRLRGAHFSTPATLVDHRHLGVDGLTHPHCELRVTVDPGDTALSGLLLQSTDGQAQPLEILYTRHVLLVDGVPAPLSLGPGEPLDLRIYLDGSTLELFTADGRLALTHAVDLPVSGFDVEIVARGGTAHLLTYDRWEMNSTW
jgi:beta-fructofuranosidase